MKNTFINSVAKILLVVLGFQSISPLLAAVITLPSGTMVQCEIKETVNGLNSNVGQRIRISVANDVMKDGEVVIRGGTDVQAEIVSATKPGFLGKPGEVGIVLKSTKAVDGTTISLSASRVNKGDSKQTISVVVGLFLCFFALFMKGEDGTLQSGSVIDANTVSEYQINT